VEDPSLLTRLLAAGLAHCQVTVEAHGSLLGSLFLAGLVGSLGHCVGMCGPFVLSQTVSRLEAVPALAMREWHRLAGAALIPYHLGRATTYGALAAVATGGVALIAEWRGLSAALLAIAALFFLLYAARGVGLRLPALDGSRTGGWWSRHIGPLARPLLDRPVGWRGYLLGIVLGFLPCGLLYGALAAAASSGDALAGGLAMLAFAIGTVPALLAVGLAGHVAGSRWRRLATRLAPALLVVKAAALSYLAWRLAA
jgi:hypothetical protein